MNAKADELWPVVAKQIYKICENDNFIFKLNFIDANKFKYINNIPLFYRQVITSFNKAKGVDNDLFCNTILDQPLWGNRYISCNNAQGVNMTLLFKGWNECGLVKVGNLKFVNGTVDDEFIFHTVRRKANIIAEILMIKKALKPYKHLIGDHEPHNNRDIPLFHGKKQKIYNFICTRSKYFYTCMVGLKCCKPIEKEVFWTNVLGNDDIDVNMMYTSKIINIKDKKIAEFNYKVLHTILPCNVNLVRWKKAENKKCMFCKEDEDIPHLLFNCVYAQTIWQTLRNDCNFNISLEDIIVGSHLNPTYNFVVSVICYCIYKSWLLHSLGIVNRRIESSVNRLKGDLASKNNIYIFSKWNDISDILTSIINVL